MSQIWRITLFRTTSYSYVDRLRDCRKASATQRSY
jgi:hypothetical protein